MKKALIFLCLFLSNITLATPNNQEDPSLIKYLNEWKKEKIGNYSSALFDLDNDGEKEAIIYLLDREFCGSGGCQTLILKKRNDEWNKVADISISQLPIKVLNEQKNGWKSISVIVSGGGISRSYEAVLEFDGKTYPNNPSLIDERKTKTKGVEVLSKR